MSSSAGKRAIYSPEMISEPVWIDDHTLRVDGVDFVYSAGESTVDRFCIRKPRPLVESTLELVGRFHTPRIFELGIARGGSTALLALASEPAKLVAVELSTERVAALDELIERRGLNSTVRVVYGVDQGDRQQVAAIADDEFGSDQLDLVIDDASHRLEESRASFETLFPRLRTDGLYVIEDWNWQMQLRYALAGRPGDPGGASRSATGPEPLDREESSRAALHEYVKEHAGLAPLETLALELVVARACSGHAVRELVIGEHWVVVRRGAGDLDPTGFRLAANSVGPLSVLTQEA
jgi:predicted O-methyltransferase YrrM